MQSSWKAIYPWIQSALIACPTLEEFCQQAIAQVATTYEVEGWLWIGLENPEELQVYRSHEHAPEPNYATLPDGLSWLTDQHPSLQTTQLHTGDLVIPIIHPVQSVTTGELETAHKLALQLRRPHASETSVEGTPSVLLSATQPQTAIYGWSVEELNSLEIVASQIGLAYELFQARQQVQQVRQQVALLSRTAYLLNSTLSLEEQLPRLLADWGHNMGGDRGFVVRWRDQVLVPLATWNLDPLFQKDIFAVPQQWSEVVDLFDDGAASHLEFHASTSPNALGDLAQAFAQQGSQSGLLMPIQIQGQFFGLVGLLSATPHPHYRVDKLQTLHQATEQLAIALAALYHPASALPDAWGTPEALHDPLTDCETRVALERVLDTLESHASWDSETLSLVLCDLDYFKLVNDTYGYGVGDQILQAIAQRMREQVRQTTKIYRYGGEEFAMLLPDTPLNAALRVAERLRWAIGTTSIKTAAGEVSITASFGVAQHQADQDHNGWSMFRRAELALQDAKRQGRDQVIG
jgi:diguanylate cyclase (GGDEF)-like protein